MLLELNQAAPKAAGSFDRVCAPEVTLANEAAIRAYYGITRVAETTYLDRIGIPVFSAIVPESHDSTSVYNGKGLTRAAARAGAIMEAAERGAVTHATLPVRTVRSAELSDPFRQLVETSGPVEVVSAHDLLSDSAIDVPAFRATSNGLAGGNTLSEAVYHALCELVERHVLSVVHAIAHERPRELLARFVGRRMEIPGFVDDAVTTEYSVPTGSSIVDGLIEQIVAAGLAVRLRAVELQPFPMLFIATIDQEGSVASRAHPGYGCSLSPEHAAIRALTEAAQGRLTDIQSAREDLVCAEDPFGDDRHRRLTNPPWGWWYFDAPARPARFSMLRDRSSRDVATDVETIISALRTGGFRHAAIVDLSPSSLPISVVRAIVPGMETAIVDGVIGPTIATILDITHDISAIDTIVR